MRAELEHANARALELVATADALKVQLAETVKLNELQAADLARYKKLIDAQPTQHQPERVEQERLQLVFESMAEAKAVATVLKDAKAEADAAEAGASEPKPKPNAAAGRRRGPDMSKLRVVEERIVPPEVAAVGGTGWRQLEPEVTTRLALRQAEFVQVRVTRERWVRVDEATGVAQFAVAPVPVCCPSRIATSSPCW